MDKKEYSSLRVLKDTHKAVKMLAIENELSIDDVVKDMIILYKNKKK
jgi:hypothetical protein